MRKIVRDRCLRHPDREVVRAFGQGQRCEVSAGAPAPDADPRWVRVGQAGQVFRSFDVIAQRPSAEVLVHEVLESLPAPRLCHDCRS